MRIGQDILNLLFLEAIHHTDGALLAMRAIAFAVEVNLALEVIRVLSDQHREHAYTVYFRSFLDVDRKLRAGDEHARKKQWEKSGANRARELLSSMRRIVAPPR
ncbi:MAG: hypothetical protein WAS49_09500 [Candidatus Dechloromonas phosphoritropha]|nr:hypothetical protein [Candidatus Dechloromonas phosphoritropha]MBP8788884.1 hypothetical protein [Azonexus sp.]MBP9229281.1 hypothetical protein [Azonexus sp.]